MKNKIQLIILTILCILCISACSEKKTVLSDENVLNVYTSFNAMYRITQEIAGDKANVGCIMPSGSEPHEWEPSAADIVKLEKSDLFIYSSDEMETWVADVTDSLSNSKLSIIETAENIEKIENEHGSSDSHSHTGDPHVWLNPMNALAQAQKITDALCNADRTNTDYYKQNLHTFTDKINTLNNEYISVLDTAKTKSIIVSHEAYGYLCSAYGLQQIGIEGVNAENEPSPAKLAEIVDFAKHNNIKYIFAENNENTKLADAVAKEINGKTLILNPFETGNEDYFTVMENNLISLKKALCE